MLGSLPILSLIATIILATAGPLETPGGDPISKGAVIGLMLTVTGFFAVIYGILLRARYEVLAPYKYLKGNGYGVMVDLGTYKGATFDGILVEFDRTFGAWSTVFGVSKIKPAAKGVFWVTFKEGVLQVPGRGKNFKAAGYTVPGSNRLVVGHKEADTPVEKTALAHELGHNIQFVAFGGWNEAEHHKRSSEHHLP